MSYDTNTSVHSRAISALFDTEATARKAVDDLIRAGVPREDISQTGGQGAADLAGASDDDAKGFWESLRDLFMPDEDRYAYAEGLRRGGYLVSVRTDEANYSRVLDILDREGSVNMDEREGQWRSEGWSGFAGNARDSDDGLTTGAAALAGATADATTGLSARPIGSQTNYETDTAARAAALGTTGSTTAQSRPRATGSLAAGQDEVVPVYEEQLRVGKRDVNHGRIRVRSYVVETPVSEQVNLRDEKVFVDRKPVDRPVGANDALFQDRVIEVEEHAEEAVISKEARVKEEITLRKTAEDRVQNVSDTVRHTEVEVEDDRAKGLTGGVSRFSAQTDSSRIVEHMDVISADGQKIGTVDHLDGPDRIKLAKSTSPDGQHHLVPFAWIDHIDQHVHLNKTLAEIKAGR